MSAHASHSQRWLNILLNVTQKTVLPLADRFCVVGTYAVY
jgi:hypothetical protein